jgi:hypothetical protein
VATSLPHCLCADHHHVGDQSDCAKSGGRSPAAGRTAGPARLFCIFRALDCHPPRHPPCLPSCALFSNCRARNCWCRSMLRRRPATIVRLFGNDGDGIGSALSFAVHADYRRIRRRLLARLTLVHGFWKGVIPFYSRRLRSPRPLSGQGSRRRCGPPRITVNLHATGSLFSLRCLQ